MVQHDGTAWGNPIAPGNNSANTASATVSLLGLFSVGSLPPANSFIFNALPNKIIIPVAKMALAQNKPNITIIQAKIAMI
jgi:hypothetical protein